MTARAVCGEEVAALRRAGYSPPQAAAELGVSVATVSRHTPVELRQGWGNGRPSSERPQPLPRDVVELGRQVDAGAACRGRDTEEFFPDLDAPDYDELVQAAKQVCASCPVREACLEYALTRPVSYGIWGGRTELERGQEQSRRTAVHRGELAA